MLATGTRHHHNLIESYWVMTAAAYEYHLYTAGYDDLAWYALAWLRAVTLTGKAEYAHRAAAIHREMAKVWDGHCGGGVWWDRKKTYKNAITNELFITLSMGLYRATGTTSYLTWAEQGWAWFEASGMIQPNGLVVDGISMDCTATSSSSVYTYNQGVFLGGAVQLYLEKNDTAYLSSSLRTVRAALSKLSQEGVLQESISLPGSHDSQQFKGIFLRYVAYFVEGLDVQARQRYAAELGEVSGYLRANAAAILSSDTDAEGHFGYFFQGPVSNVTYITHTSGLDALTAAYALR
eukprot:TRINITY_DN15052_c0_g1_i3.p1 TRINITY_DN15052_c0_g1~~TRINITY_DN15052_c0_g1_i3.p1  ORF type:complete len:293 (+),score=105.98 TRINITY_DN15052_c0_g1_i3:177-1055(+)